MDIIKTFSCALILGLIFNRLQLAIPCPPTIEGILGIIGLFIGFKLGGML